MQQTAIPEITNPDSFAETSASLHAKRNWRDVIQDYTELTKPRIIVLLLITTAGAMWIASEGAVDLFLMLITVLG
jgi:protoheme IX farnesyltransferase